jgi:hypothetical protein
VRIEAPAHHGLGVGPLGVGDEQHLLASRSLVEQGRGDALVGDDVAPGVGDDPGLERALHVRLVECRRHGGVELVVAEAGGEPSVVETVDQLGVQRRLRQREEGVEESPAGILEIDEVAGVGARNSSNDSCRVPWCAWIT